MMMSDIATTVESEAMILSGITAEVEIGAESGRIATGSAGTERRRRAVNISLQDVSSTRAKRAKATGATSTKRTSATKRKRRPVMRASQREMNKMLRSNGPPCYPVGGTCSFASCVASNYFPREAEMILMVKY